MPQPTSLMNELQKPKYSEFLKSWSAEHNITSFFGSDKPDFLDAWKQAKSANVAKKPEPEPEPEKDEIVTIKGPDNAEFIYSLTPDRVLIQTQFNASHLKKPNFQYYINLKPELPFNEKNYKLALKGDFETKQNEGHFVLQIVNKHNGIKKIQVPDSLFEGNDRMLLNKRQMKEYPYQLLKEGGYAIASSYIPEKYLKQLNKEATKKFMEEQKSKPEQ